MVQQRQTLHFEYRSFQTTKMAHTQNTRPTCEKLYLYRGKDANEDIYVESSLQQHHIDGIRFLYKQFKNGNPGVILNNPLGYGNSLQVTLFLGAIKHKLDKPILVLCDEGEEDNWLELFQKITDTSNVVVNAADAFLKKSIFINNMNGVAEFTRRTWGVVVVDSDALLKMKTVQNKLEADYKIWITPLAMKENLQTFTLIYKWIFSKEKFNTEDFKGKPEDCRDFVSKSIQLAAFFKDIVFKTNLPIPNENPPENKFETRHKTSFKNKDATGTKIKRTKRTIEETKLEKVNIESEARAIKIPRVCNGSSPKDNYSVSEYQNSSKKNNCKSDVTNIDTKNSDLDIESFISSKKPMNDYRDDFEDISNSSQENETSFLNDSHMMFKEKDKPNNDFVGSKKSNSLSTKYIISPQEDTKVSPGNEDDDAYELETQQFLIDNNMEIDDSNYLNENKTGENYPCTKETCDTDDQQALLKENATETEISALNNHMDTSKEQGTINEIQKQANEDNEIEDIQNANGMNKSHECIVNDELQNSKSENKNKTLDLDSKITEHEDRIFKKFKGTFLDSIF
ncbi:hypothetical protein evm_008120 [Chilo suppressalis]|nr:hypothetical protein evm_008120 [Chilo suppressalis]